MWKRWRGRESERRETQGKRKNKKMKQEGERERGLCCMCRPSGINSFREYHVAECKYFGKEHLNNSS